MFGLTKSLHLLCINKFWPEAGQERYPESVAQTKNKCIMKENQMIENWKNTEMSQIVGNSQISKEMMSEVQGGVGQGYIKTISGECNTTRTSCWKAAYETVKKAFDTVL
jgi:hypothetical protein